MKKVISFIQKYASTGMVLVFALMAIYAVCMATPTANCASYGGVGKEDVSSFYKNFQTANDVILYIAIAGLILAFLYKGLRSGIRKIYYVGNFVSSALLGACGVFGGVYTLIAVAKYQKGYSQLPIDTMNQYWIDHGSSLRIDGNPVVFPLGYALGVVLIIAGILVLCVLVSKLLGRLSYEKARQAKVNSKEAA